jgi:hypothetical protein
VADPRPLTPADYCLDAVGHGCFARDLDGVVQAFVPSIRDRLIARGVLTQRRDTRWYLSWHGFDLAREQAADLSCCDFCSARPVTWLCPCASFPMPSRPGLPPGISTGDWAACDPCGILIADGSPAAKANLLIRAQRAAATQLPRHAAALPGLARTLRELKEELHVRFWRHYRGGAVALPAHPFGH